MKYLFLLLLIILGNSIFLNAQTKADSIKIIHSDYFIAGIEYSGSDISDTLASNPASAGLIHTSRVYRTIGAISLCIGIVLAGATVVGILNIMHIYGSPPKHNTSYLVVGCGAGVDILTIIFLNKSKTYFRQAVSAYNSNLSENNCIEHEFKFYFSLNRVGFSYRF